MTAIFFFVSFCTTCPVTRRLSEMPKAYKKFFGGPDATRAVFQKSPLAAGGKIFTKTHSPLLKLSRNSRKMILLRRKAK
jgi:hypothetical protein